MSTNTAPKNRSTTNAHRSASAVNRQRDAIAILKADHREVERLFKAFEKTSERALVERKDLVDTMIEKLSVHAAIEEQIVYPWAQAHIVDEDDQVLEAFEEHRVVKFLLGELSLMNSDDGRFQATTTVLIEIVRHHVREEESELLLDLRDVATRAELVDFGLQLDIAKKAAAAGPEAGGILPAIGSGVGGVIDHAIDVGRGVVSKVGALTGLD